MLFLSGHVCPNNQQTLNSCYRFLTQNLMKTVLVNAFLFLKGQIDFLLFLWSREKQQDVSLTGRKDTIVFDEGKCVQICDHCVNCSSNICRLTSLLMFVTSFFYLVFFVSGFQIMDSTQMRKLDTLCLLVTSMSCKVKVLGPPLVEESAFSDDLNRKVIVRNFCVDWSLQRYTKHFYFVYIFCQTKMHCY